MPTALLWDLDGVLIDTGQLHYETWLTALSAAGHRFTPEMFRHTFGMNNRGVLTVVLGREPTEAELTELADHKEALFRDLIQTQARPLPGVQEWLARLHAGGWRQAVASSAPIENIHVMIDALGLRSYFDALVSGSRIPGKPNPAVFLEAARQVDVPPANCVVVEDAVAGVAAAKAAGMRCLAVTTTNPAHLLSAADQIVPTLAGLPPDTFDRLLASTPR